MDADQEARASTDVELTHSLLAAAQGRLVHAPSYVSSASSEERDTLHEAKSIEEELERKSVRSDVSGARSATSAAKTGSVAGENAVLPRSVEDMLNSSASASKAQAYIHSGSGSGRGSGRSGSGSGRSGHGSRHGSHSGSGHLSSEPPTSSSRNISAAATSHAHSGTQITQAGSGSSGSTSERKKYQSAVKATMTATQVQCMQEAMDDLALEHNTAMQNAKDAKDKSDVENQENVDELHARIAALLKDARGNANLQELLNSARADKIEANDARDDLKDQIAGMLARQNLKNARHEKELERLEEIQQKKLQQAHADEESKLYKLNEQVEEQLMELLRLREANKVQLNSIQIQEQSGFDAARQHGLDLAQLQGLLDTAKQELVQQKLDAGLDDESREKRRSKDSKDKIQLQKELAQSRTVSRDVSNELTASRLELLEMQEVHRLEVAGLQTKLTASNNAANANTKGIMRHAKQHKTKKLEPLRAIEEEFDLDDVGSQGAGSGISGQVSGIDDCVANLVDFDDEAGVQAANEGLIAQLREQIRQQGLENKQLQDDNAAIWARGDSKANRLLSQLAALRSEQTDQIAAAYQLKLENDDLNDIQLEEIAQQRKRLADIHLTHEGKLENIVAAHDVKVEELQEAFEFMKTAKDYANQCLNDTKWELKTQVLRYEEKIKELESKIQVLEVCQSGISDLTQLAAFGEMKARLAESEQNLNMLTIQMEGVQVNLEGQLDHEVKQHQLTKLMLQKTETELCREKETNASLREQLATAGSSKKEVEVPATEPAKQGFVLDFGMQLLGALKCPSRSDTLSYRAAGPSCQAVAWQLLKSLRHIIALRCNADQLLITDASRAAFEFWGSSHLRGPGATLLRLVSSNLCGKEWLQQEIVNRKKPQQQNIGYVANSDWLWDLECIELLGKDGAPFDATLLIAHLKKELQHEDGDALFAIVQPLGEVRDQKRHRKGAYGASDSSAGRAPSSISSVNAMDSISNIVA